MSYSFHVEFKDAKLQVVDFSDDVPEGIWQVGGHEDDYGVSINVTHQMPDGRFVAEAQHYRSDRNYSYILSEHPGIFSDEDDLPEDLPLETFPPQAERPTDSSTNRRNMPSMSDVYMNDE